MSKAKLIVARELIKEKKYDEARMILKGVDHPTAKQWLDKLDKIAATQQNYSHISRYLFILTVMITIFVLYFAISTLVAPSDKSTPDTAMIPTEPMLPTIASTATSAPNRTFTPKPTATLTTTPTPSFTATITNTATPRLTNTPMYGNFENPAPRGSTMLRTYILGDELNVTVLDVLRGSPAYELAKSEMGRFFLLNQLLGKNI
jgi:hypothetical protein